MFITIKCVSLFKINSIYFIKANWQLSAKSLQSRSCIWAVWRQGGVPTRRLLWNVVSPGAVVCLRTQRPWAGGRQLSGGNRGDHPSYAFLSLSEPYSRWVLRVWFEALFPCSMRWGQTRPPQGWQWAGGKVQKWILSSVLWALLSSQLQLLLKPCWQPACLHKSTACWKMNQALGHLVI